jgi:hypothetical protein
MAIDPVTKRLRKMRLLNNCPTVWQDEQKEFLDVKAVEKNVRSIQFSNGRAVIEMYDQPAIDYVTYSGHNLNNPNFQRQESLLQGMESRTGSDGR